MTDVTQLLPGGGRVQPQRQVVTGYVSTNKPAPVDFSSALYVILPSLSTDYSIGPCKWGAAQGSTLPARGTEVFVCFDDENVPVVVWWEGSTAFAPTGSAGGDLTGSYPNPTIGAGKVTSTAIADGTIAVGDLATATVQNFLQLLVGASLKLAHGSSTATFTASTVTADVTITHGLGATPVRVWVSGTDANTCWWGNFTRTSTTFKVRGSYASALSTTMGFEWFAIG